jgi:hypothetical protein
LIQRARVLLPVLLPLQGQVLLLEPVLVLLPALVLARELGLESVTAPARRTRSPGVWRKGRW